MCQKYDGNYAIVTSKYDKTDSEILIVYRGLLEIEETFKLKKRELETRPVHVRKTELTGTKKPASLYFIPLIFLYTSPLEPASNVFTTIIVSFIIMYIIR